MPNALFSLLCSLASHHDGNKNSNQRIKDEAQEKEAPKTSTVPLGIAAYKYTQEDVKCKDAKYTQGDDEIIGAWGHTICLRLK